MIEQRHKHNNLSVTRTRNLFIKNNNEVGQHRRCGLPRVKIEWKHLKWILFGRTKQSIGVNDYNITAKRRLCCQHKYCRDDGSNIKRGTFTRFAALFRFAFRENYIEVSANDLRQVQGDVDPTKWVWQRTHSRTAQIWRVFLPKWVTLVY